MTKSPKDSIVKKSNAIIRGHWSVSNIWEPRLVALLASKIRVEDEDFKLYNIRISEVLGSKYGGKDMILLSKCVKNVMKHVIEIHETPAKTAYYNIFCKCLLDKDTRLLTLQFHPDLKPHYLQLHEKFTEYALEEFMQLTSSYSQRLYEILKSWDDKAKVDIKLGDLCNMLDAPQSYRDDFRQFRLRVLTQAHKDITEKTRLWFAWTPIKGPGKGSKVVAIRFFFTKKAMLAESTVKEETKKKQERVETETNIAKYKESSACFLNHQRADIACTPNLVKDLCCFCTSHGIMATFKITDSASSPTPVASPTLQPVGGVIEKLMERFDP